MTVTPTRADIRDEVRRCTAEAMMEVMESKKISALTKAELGLKYEKQQAMLDLARVNTVVNIASLYSQTDREKLAKAIVPPRFEIIPMESIEIGISSQIKSFQEAYEAEKTKSAEARQREAEERAKTEVLEKEKQKLEDKLADIKDEKDAKEKPIFQKLAQDEYQLKREATK